ncbi:hypothetical protein HV336_03995 [Citrobacter freundii]|uniref:hypothetical protein n=1 Tax=Citrobacter freundii TaxID=546 RepID=UPI0015E9EB15|nr:hypothetical protein [Citrobacter freundii]QLR76100.1 hypothetical protein HV336_03995 [Citrobacter freundii]
MIHGFALPESEDNDDSSPLIFDIDYIVKWGECSTDDSDKFIISQGILCSYNVTDLILKID